VPVPIGAWLMGMILNIKHNAHPATSEARQWTQILNRYREPSHARSIAELVITALPLVALWLASWFAFSLGHWWASPLMLVATYHSQRRSVPRWPVVKVPQDFNLKQPRKNLCLK